MKKLILCIAIAFAFVQYVVVPSVQSSPAANQIRAHHQALEEAGK